MSECDAKMIFLSRYVLDETNIFGSIYIFFRPVFETLYMIFQQQYLSLC